jgi:IS1 family transposase
MFFVNKLSTNKRIQILQMLCEGSSTRSISRVVDVSINTVTKLLVDAGTACAAYHDANVKGIKSKRIQCDEIWSFCCAKDKNIPEDRQDTFGYDDVWTFTAIDADTKKVPTWHVGSRDLENATLFLNDLASRLSNSVQLTTDGHKMYLDAVESALGPKIDFSQLVKIYEKNEDKGKKYSRAERIDSEKIKINGNSGIKAVSTSHAERPNLTMRMSTRQFTPLTNAFSKKLQNYYHALAIYFMFYNFVRIHKALNVSPAMAAGLTDKLWSLEDIVNLIDGKEKSM